MADERQVEETRFEIEGQMYPMPQSFRLGDPVLVTQLTGLTWGQFVEALDDPDRQQDPVILLGLIAVAVWQGNPRWTRDRISRYVEQLDIGAVQVHAGEPEADPGPPAVLLDAGDALAASLVSSPETPNGSQASPSDPTPASSGSPGSAIGSAESIPA